MLTVLSGTDLLKHKAHAQELAEEVKRVKKIQSPANLAAHAAASEYLASKDMVGADKMSLKRAADKHETTVSMVRTAIKNQTEPFSKRKPGPQPQVSEQDLDAIAQYCLQRALDDKAVTKMELSALMLRFVNQNRARDGKSALNLLGDKRYNLIRAALTRHCDQIGLPLVICHKTGSVDKRRRTAEKVAVPVFMKTLQRYKEQFPTEFENPANWMNLDEQALSEKSSKGKTQTTAQFPSATGGIRGAAADENAAPPCTMVSTTFADGRKGPAIFLRKGSTPLIESWFSQLPPGLSQADVKQTVFGVGDTDRMTLEKLIDILENTVYAKHAPHASGQLFWVLDAPT